MSTQLSLSDSHDSRQLEQRLVLAHHSKPINSLCVNIYLFTFFPFMQLLMASNIADDSSIVLWNVITGEKLQVIERPVHGAVEVMTWASLEGRDVFISGHSDDSLRLHSKTTDKVSESHLYISACAKIVFSRYTSCAVWQMATQALWRLLATILSIDDWPASAMVF